MVDSQYVNTGKQTKDFVRVNLECVVKVFAEPLGLFRDYKMAYSVFSYGIKRSTQNG